MNKKKIEDKNFERGNLLYSTPSNKKGSRIIAMTLFILGLFFPIAIIHLEFQLKLWETLPLYEYVTQTLIWIILISLEYAVIFYISHRLLHPEYKIYENGITHPFISVFFHKEDDFIPFSRMKSFSISKDGKTCYISLDNKGSGIIWKSYDLELNQYLINTLKSLNIVEKNT